MEYKKLVFSKWFKTYEIITVSKETYLNSPKIENVGSMTGIKIKDLDHQVYLTTELTNKGFCEE